MPIYEYRCQNCHRKTEVILQAGVYQADVSCPHCGSQAMQRVMSTFAYHQSEKDRLAQIDTSKPQHENYYRDDRNIGLWAKKRMQELGHDPGAEFEGIVEKAKKEVKEKLSD